MRPDMFQVLIERPRVHANRKDPKGYKKNLHKQLESGDTVRRESLTKRWNYDGKQQTDVLGPLKRFLFSNVNRPWDKIFSEIMEHVDLGNQSQKHILTHLFQFVELAKDVEVEGSGKGRKVYRKHADWRHRYEIRSGGTWPQFYVDPRTGILREAPKRGSSKYRAPKNTAVKIDDNHVAARIEDVWYSVEVRTFKEMADEKTYSYPAVHPYRKHGIYTHTYRPSSIYDVAVRKELSSHEAQKIYGAPLIGISKKALNKREIKKLGLEKIYDTAA